MSTGAATRYGAQMAFPALIIFRSAGDRVPSADDPACLPIGAQVIADQLEGSYRHRGRARGPCLLRDERAVFAVLLLARRLRWRGPAYDPAAEEARIRHVIADMESGVESRRFPRLYGRLQESRRGLRLARPFQQGWQGTLDHYVRDYGGAPERRGRLHFWDIRIEMLAPDAAQLIGRYRLDRRRPSPGRNQHPPDAQGRRPLGDRAQPCRARRT